MSVVGTSDPKAVAASPIDVVRSFLVLLQNEELDGALSLLADDVVWENVSLPTVRGRRNVERILRKANQIGGGFRVHFDNIAAEGNVVLTERVDAITLGRFHHQFWVAGRFELRDGVIVVWHDAFDWRDYAVGFVRALAGIALPSLNRRWPPES